MPQFPQLSPICSKTPEGSGGLLAWPSFLCLHCDWQSCALAADVHLFLASQQPPSPHCGFHPA